LSSRKKKSSFGLDIEVTPFASSLPRLIVTVFFYYFARFFFAALFSVFALGSIGCDVLFTVYPPAPRDNNPTSKLTSSISAPTAIGGLGDRFARPLFRRISGTKFQNASALCAS
jgi:hypothetical protein